MRPFGTGAGAFFATTVITAAGALLGPTIAAHAAPLDPTLFESQGTLSVNNGTVTINTGNGTSLPTFVATGGIAGAGEVFTQPGSGIAVAVYDFDAISFTGSTIVSVTGSIPLALLSRGNFDLTGTAAINLAPGKVGGGVGGSSGQDGGGPGAGRTGSPGSGGGFGGQGGYGQRLVILPVVGGSAYGNLANSLQGGSGGGGGSAGAAGGPGGGAIEIVAVNNLNIAGNGVDAHGAAGGTDSAGGAGAGSGGGILLAANSVTLAATLNASATGTGGGGRILAETGPGGFHFDFVNGNPVLNPLGGGGGFVFGLNSLAVDGTADILPFANTNPALSGVPEPSTSSILLAAAGAAAIRRRQVQ